MAIIWCCRAIARSIDYLDRIGATDGLTGPPRRRFRLCRSARPARAGCSGPMTARLPWWVASRRPPRARHRGRRLSPNMPRCCGPTGKTRIGEIVPSEAPLWDRLMQPFLLAALNTEPRDRFGRSWRARCCARPWPGRPRLSPAHRHSPALAAAFIDPALEFLEREGAEIDLGTRLRGLRLRRARRPGAGIRRRHRAARLAATW